MATRLLKILFEFFYLYVLYALLRTLLQRLAALADFFCSAEPATMLHIQSTTQ